MFAFPCPGQAWESEPVAGGRDRVQPLASLCEVLLDAVLGEMREGDVAVTVTPQVVPDVPYSGRQVGERSGHLP